MFSMLLHNRKIGRVPPNLPVDVVISVASFVGHVSNVTLSTPLSFITTPSPLLSLVIPTPNSLR